MWIIKILHRNLHTLRCTCSQSTKACNNLSHPSSPSVKPQMNQLACLCVQHSQNATTHNNRSDNIVQLLGASKRWLHLRVEDWTKFLWHHAHKKPMLLLFSYKLSDRIEWKSRHNLQDPRMLFAAWTRHMRVHRNLNSKNRWNSGQLPQE